LRETLALQCHELLIHTQRNQISLTHSVSKRPGSTALMRTLEPWVLARHFIRCSARWFCQRCLPYS
jgi:hypothetical protein